MPSVRAGSLAVVRPVRPSTTLGTFSPSTTLGTLSPSTVEGVDAGSRMFEVDGRRYDSKGAERRAHVRLTPSELQLQLTARHKYGETVTLVDLSAGGALLETPRNVRPESDIVLEVLDSETKDISSIVS